MRTAFATLSCSLFLIAAAPAAATPGEINASWNSGRNDQGNVAFWIRGKGGTCEEQTKALPLVFGTKNLKAGTSSGPLQVRELSYCFLFLNREEDPKDPEGGTSSCGSAASNSPTTRRHRSTAGNTTLR